MKKEKYEDFIDTPFSGISINRRCGDCPGNDTCPLVKADKNVRVLILPPTPEYNYVRIDEFRLPKVLSVVPDIKSFESSYFSDGTYQIYCLRDDDKDSRGWMEVRWQGM